MLGLKCTDREDFAQTPHRSRRFDFFAAATACVVQGDGARIEKDQGESDGRESQWELETVVSQEAAFPVHFPNGDGKVDGDGEGGETGKQSNQDGDAPKEFGDGGEVGEPSGQADAPY